MKLLVVTTAMLVACSSMRPTERVVLAKAPMTESWQAIRATLDECSRAFALTGDLEVRVEIGNDGKVVAVDSSYDNRFASCVGRLLLRSRHRSHEGRILVISYTLAP